MVASFLPGIGNASVAVVALVFTANWDPVSVLLLFGALTGGATFMGSITAILFNIPGSVSSTAALLDGHPMARMGLAKTAIACAATASAVGSVFGVVLLLTLLPIVKPYILAFGPLEILLIGVLGLLTVVVMPTSSKMKAAIMVVGGLLAALVGSDPATGQSRWTFGSLELTQGFGIVPVMLGIYTIGEILQWTNRYDLKPISSLPNDEGDTTYRGFRAVFSNFGLTLRSSWIGTLVGMVPGIGGTVAGFVAYGHAVQSSGKENELFGKGDVRGLIAPEAAIDAKDGGSLLPTLVLGLPGSEACVILLAVFTMHGLVPGIPMLTTHLALSYTLILALLFSNILTSIVGVAMAPALSKLRVFKLESIVLPSLLVCLFSAVQTDGRMTDLYAMIFFGVASYYWRRYDWPLTPFVIAFVLGKLIEGNLVLTTQLIAFDRIDPIRRGLTLALAFIIVVFVVAVWIRRRGRGKPIQASKHSLALALITALMCLTMLFMGVFSESRYSVYAIAVASVASVLSVYYLFQCGYHWRVQSTLQEVQLGLMHEPGHGRLMCIIVSIAPFAWFVGFGPAMGLATTVWCLVKVQLTKPNGILAAVWGVGVWVLTELLMTHVGGVLLERAWLWRMVFDT